jgi:poly(3-hydroxybutyrate) depolymerase
MARLLTSFLLLLCAGLVSALTSTLQQVTNFGSNPTNVGMFVYKPTTVTAKPAVIVAIHYCTGSAQAYFTGLLPIPSQPPELKALPMLSSLMSLASS